MANTQKALEIKGFGKKVHDLRKEKDLTQADVADAIGVDKGNVSAWENDRNTPSLESIIALAKLFGVSTDYLIFDNVPREGVEAINDFELYEYFRKTEALPKEHRETVKDIVDSLVLREKIRNIPETQPVKTPKETPSLRKVAGRR